MIERSKPVSDSLYLGRFLQLASEPVPVGDLKHSPDMAANSTKKVLMLHGCVSALTSSVLRTLTIHFGHS